MRSNIARTCGSGSTPGASEPRSATDWARAVMQRDQPWLLQHGQEVDQVLELLGILLLEALERRHRGRRVDERRGDRLRSHAVADLGERRPGAVVAVVPDDVAGETAGLAD